VVEHVHTTVENRHTSAIRPLTIVFVIDSAAIGGAESLICSLIRGLPRDRFECHLICPAFGPMVSRYAEAVTGVVTVSGKRFISPRAIVTMARVMRRLQADIVHTCLYTSDVGGILAARIAGVPRVVAHVVGHNFYVTDERGMRRLRKRMLSSCYRWVYRMADQVIAVSEAVKADLVHRRGVRVAPRKIMVLRHGLLDHHAPTASAEAITRVKALCGVDEDSRLIAVIANLIPMKGHPYLLRALVRVAEAVPKATCVLVGDGPSRFELEGLVRQLGLNGRVVFAGILSEEFKHAVLQASQLVVLPSLSEGLPVVLLEAMAAGKPVVASDVGGVREIVDNGVTGFVVPPKDPEALGKAISSLLLDPVLADRLGHAGRSRAETQCSFDEMMARFQDLYVEANASR